MRGHDLWLLMSAGIILSTLATVISKKFDLEVISFGITFLSAVLTVVALFISVVSGNDSKNALNDIKVLLEMKIDNAREEITKSLSPIKGKTIILLQPSCIQGVDIVADMVIRDPDPISCLLQTSGRSNRL